MNLVTRNGSAKKETSCGPVLILPPKSNAFDALKLLHPLNYFTCRASALRPRSEHGQSISRVFRRSNCQSVRLYLASILDISEGPTPVVA
jgi:hypothetical protein